MNNARSDRFDSGSEPGLEPRESIWRIEMLGGLRILPPRAGVAGAITHFPTRKTAVLLAYIAYQQRASQNRNALADMLWPDSDSENARNALRVSLNRLRKVLLAKGYEPESLLVIDKFTIGLNRQHVVTDVAEFEQHLQAALGAPTLAARSRYLCDAVDLYRGELLRDYDENWISTQARRLEGLFFNAVRELIALLEENGEGERALRYAHQAVSVDPLCEEAHCNLLRLYLKQGQHDAARAHYESYCKALQKSFGGFQPMEVMQALQSGAVYELMEPVLRTKARSQNNQETLFSPAQTTKNRERPSILKTSLNGHRLASNGAALQPGHNAQLIKADQANETKTKDNSSNAVIRSAPWAGGSITFLLIDNLPCGSERNISEARNRAELREVIVRHGGREFGEMQGHAIWTIFRAATDALACALTIRNQAQALQSHGKPNMPWAFSEDCRMALDTSDSGLWAGRESLQSLQSGIKGVSIELLENGIKRVALDRVLSILQAGHPGQTLCSEVTGALLRRELEVGVALDDLGVYRLHDASVPERIYQVSYLALQGRVFPPVLASPLHSSELPSSATRFFGRQHDLKKIEMWLMPQPVPEGEKTAAFQLGSALPTRLVTLTGYGGCGKTRLALEAARRLRDAYQQAVWFVPLSGVRDPQLIIHAIINALRLPGAPGVDPWLKVTGELGQKPSLLVLDNFEQLHEGGVEVVKRLLSLVPTLSCLVTSRRTLVINGEQEWPVLPLAVPPLLPCHPVAPVEAEKWSQQVQESDSVKLFVDRARLARPNFELTSSNRDAVAQLCKLLDGLPLAIELVASHAHGLTPPQILSLLEPYAEQHAEPYAEQLEQHKNEADKNPRKNSTLGYQPGFDRFDFFHDERPETPQRHRSLRAAIEWSYELLDPPLQKFFARLCVFKGGWTPEAAQFIAALGVSNEQSQKKNREDEILSSPGIETSNADYPGQESFEKFIASATFGHLMQLQECSMILAEEQGTEIRFSLLDMLRRFAMEQLSEAQWAALEARHATYFLHLSERAEDELMAAGREEWLRRLDPEIDNLRAALAWTLRHEPRQCLQMAGALWRFWEARGLFAEGRDWLDRALAACQVIMNVAEGETGKQTGKEKGKRKNQKVA